MPMTPHGAFHWNELNTWSVDKAKAFYGEALGWEYEAHPMADGGTYTLCKAGETMVAGIFELKPDMGLDGVPDHWFAYIAVDDIDARPRQGGGCGRRDRPPGLRRAWGRPLRHRQGQRRRLHRLDHPGRRGLTAGGARQSTFIRMAAAGCTTTVNQLTLPHFLKAGLGAFGAARD